MHRAMPAVTITTGLIATVLSALVPWPARAMARDDDEYPKLAPFTATRFPGYDLVEIRVRDRWYRLMRLDAHPVADLVRFARNEYGRRWQKRVTEDLAEILTRMGDDDVATVDLLVVDVADGREVRLDGVEMTASNRRAAWTYARAAAASTARPAREDVPIRRVDRVHASVVDPRYAHLADLVAGADDGGMVTVQDARADLDELEWLVRHRHAYRDLRGVDVPAAFDTLRSALPPRVARTTFAIGVAKLLALFGDGHTRVDVAPSQILAPGFLPFLVEDAREGFVAVQPDRGGFVDAARPVVTHLDGRPLDAWITAASEIVADGSLAFVRHHAMRTLRHVNHLRRELGLPERPDVSVRLTSLDGSDAVTVELRVVDRMPLYGAWPRTATRRLDGDIGYLRIARMDDAGTASIDEWLQRFAGTKGLIVDVRGNGGGTRDAFLALARYVVERPHVGNVAAFRLREGDDPEQPAGFLGNRYLYPASWPGWGDEARAAVEAALATFRPEWTPPVGDFSAWHALVVLPGPSRYDRHVVVLTDGGCFSATDVFVGGLEPLPDVTLLGTATGGGSGRSRPARLAHSRLDVRLASMASFRPDGRLYDTRGIAPDVEVRPSAAYFVGGSDPALDAALERLGR